MVVAYKGNAVTAFVLRTLGIVKVRYFSLPNLLAGRALVPEFLQEQVRGAALADALLEQIEEPARVAELQQEFTAIHRALRLDGAARAAQAILRCLQRRTPSAGHADARAPGV
jgi:lipid-A-disaccharide synthase